MSWLGPIKIWAALVVAAVSAAAAVALVVGTKDAEAAFAGENGRIAFASNRDGQITPDLYTMRSNGRGVLRLTTTGFVEESDWHPRGTRIAFTDGDIHVAKADGTILANVPNPSSFRDLSPAWSPDGRRIAFVGTRSRGGSDRDIYTVLADGTGLRVVTQNTLEEGSSVDWSSRKRIAFERGGNIYSIKPDGSGETLLTSDPNGGGVTPEWSPDGTRIAYSRNGHIWTMNANGSGKGLLYGDGFLDIDPSLSPDGQTIAFESKQPFSNSDFEIYTVGVGLFGTSGPLTNNSVDDISPAWQPIIP